MHSLQTTSIVTRLGLCSLAVILMHGGACRERTAAPKTGIPVSPAEVNRLSKLLSAQAATKQKIHRHFKESGYRFVLCLAEGRGGAVTDLGQSESMLICGGVEAGARAIEVERELHALLSPDEQDGMRIVFEMGVEGGTQLLGSASQFMEYTAERTEAERMATLIREGVGIDFGTVENKFATANQLHEFVQYGVNEKGAVVYLVVGSGMNRSPLSVSHRTDSSGRKSVRATLEIGDKTDAPPDVANNAVFCVGESVTRLPLGSFTELSLLEWINQTHGVTPEALNEYHANRRPAPDARE